MKEVRVGAGSIHPRKAQTRRKERQEAADELTGWERASSEDRISETSGFSGATLASKASRGHKE